MKKGKNALIMDKLITAIKTERLKLVGGYKNWYSLTLDIVPLVWARNDADGYKISVFKDGEHIGTITIDYTREEKNVYTYEAKMSHNEVTQRLAELKY